MELRQLEAFVRVAEMQSFTRAAEALMLTQSAVTRQVAALERELRVPLLERLGRSVRLTEAGEALYPYAAEALRLAGDAARAVANVRGGAAGRLSVGASSTAATYYLPLRLKAFRERYPGIAFNVRTGASAQIAEMVAAGTVDVGVVTDFLPRTGLREVPLAEHRTGVVVYPSHPLAGYISKEDGGLRAEELAPHDLLLMPRGTNLRSYADRLFSAAGAEPNVTMELDSVEAIKKMVEARMGISLLPRVAVEAEVSAGRLAALPLASPGVDSRRIGLIYREDKYLTVSLRAFVEWLERAG